MNLERRILFRIYFILQSRWASRGNCGGNHHGITMHCSERDLVQKNGVPSDREELQGEYEV